MCMTAAVIFHLSTNVPSWVKRYHVYKDSSGIKIVELLELKHVPKNKTKMQQQLQEIEVQSATTHLHWQAQRKAQELFIIHFPAKMGSTADVKVVENTIIGGTGYGMEVL